MNKPNIKPVICACGWQGTLRQCAPCPACKRPYGGRVTQERLALLRALYDDPRAERDRTMLAWLVRNSLAVACSPPLPPTSKASKVDPVRPYRPTSWGRKIIAIADRVITEQARHDVAASVVRHADLDAHFERMAPGALLLLPVRSMPALIAAATVDDLTDEAIDIAINDGPAPMTSLCGDRYALAVEVKRHRATMKRLEAWAAQLETGNNGEGVGPFIAAELAAPVLSAEDREALVRLCDYLQTWAMRGHFPDAKVVLDRLLGGDR